MSNTLTALMPKILARGLKTLRETCIMPQLVNASYGADAKAFGSTIDVPVPTAQVASDVVPSNTPPAPSGKTPTTVQITLDQWKKSDFFLTDADMKQIDAKANFLPMQTEEAIRVLANAVNAHILSKYKGIFGFVGAPATTPFATTSAAATDARKILNKQLCPRVGRNGVLDADAEANALALATFANFEQTGDAAVKIEGKLGRKYGIDWYFEDALPTHTAGLDANYLVNDPGGAIAVGDKLVPIDTGAAAGLLGDIVTFAGDAQTYVLTAAYAGGAGNIAIEPGLKKIPANNSAIAVKASHLVNMVFHRDAFAFANRPLEDVVVATNNQILTMQDPVSQLTLRLEISRQYKQTVWEFDILWGAALVRRELATRIAG